MTSLLSIDGDNYQDLGSSVIFWPAFGSKTDIAAQRQSDWKLAVQDRCPVFNIVKWIRRLLHLREVRLRGKRISALFITTRERLAAATRAVIAGWVRSALLAARIDASPRSFRSAVGSSRLNSGSSLDDVLSRGNWRSCRTFFNHYYRQVQKS